MALNGAKSALGFLTRLPVSVPNPAVDLVAWFWLPGVLAGALWGLAAAWSGAAHKGLWLALTAEILLTGGLHWDGWADTFDGWMASPGSRAAARQDSRIGTGGVLAIGLALGAFWMVWPTAGTLSPLWVGLPALWARAAIAWGLQWKPVDDSSRLLRWFQEEHRERFGWITLVMTTGITVTVMGWAGLIGFGVVLMVVALFLAGMRRIYHGVHGDMLGATVVLTELAGLAVIGLLGRGLT
ncbi:MAG: adenosylcobinamide-GDP ribazoletransferase [Sulfobacillus sp.]|nr:adenosylcobinamide-GDP ribazoletransferase [Sulfobacillus sp.]